MSLVSSLFTGVTGLASNSEAMGVIGDNISNVNTVGFKGSKAVFSDIFSSVLSNGSTTSQLGRGSQLSGTLRSLEQGSFEASSNALDLAIDGSGFLIVNDGTGNFYTRAGQFRMNDNGKVQAITGEVLQGNAITNGVASNQTENIDLAGVQSIPQATDIFELGANLNSAATAAATFNSPTPSILLAIIGIPDHSKLLYLNLYVLSKFTSFLLLSVLLFGLNKTSE